MLKSSSKAAAVAALILAPLLLSSCTRAAKAARHTHRADEYFASGDFEKAKIEYMNVLRTSGPSAQAIKRLGQIWYEQGAMIEAAPFLLRARDLDGSDVDNRLRLARTLETIGHKADARNEAMALLQQAPDNGEALLLVIECSVSQDELGSAEQAINEFPQKNSAYYELALAQLTLRRGDVAGAEKDASAAVAADPKLPVAHAALAALSAFKNDRERARQELKAAADLSPVRSTARIRYAEFLAQNGALEEAVNYLREQTKEAKDYFPAWIALARMSLAAKDYDKALAQVQHVLDENGRNPDALVVRANALLGKGQTKDAITLLSQLDQTYPNTPAVKYQLAQAHLRDNNVPQATTGLEEAVAADPNYSDAVLLLAQINIRSGKAAAAIPALENIVKTQPTQLQAPRILADAYRSIGKLDEAAAIFRKQIQAVPNWAEPYYLLGLVLREQKKDEEARQAFSKAGEIEPRNPVPVEQLVEMDLAAKQYDVARGRVQQQLLDRDPNSAPAHFLLGKIFAAQQQWDSAEAELRRALDIDPNLDVAYRLLVSAYISSGRLAEAATELEAAAAKNPSNTAVLFTLGMVYSALKDYPKSRDVLQKVVELRPNAVLPLNNLAVLYSERFDNIDKALELATKARSLAPADPHVADTLGWILYKRGDYQQASSVLAEAAGKLADSAEVQFHYGMARYMMGAADEARTALQKAVDSPTEFDGKEDARRHLSQLAQGGGNTAAVVSVPELRKMVEAHPNDVVAVTHLADALDKQGAYEEAAKWYEKAIQLNPKLLPPLLKLAQLNAGPLKQSAKALEFAKKARDIAPPNDPDAGAILGRVAYDSGNFDWAYSVLQQVAKQRADDPETLRAFAWSAYSIGRVPEAKQAMERVAKTSRDPATLDDARRFLSMTKLTDNPQNIASAAAEVQQVLQKQPDYLPALMAQALIQAQQGDKPAAAATYSRVLQQRPAFAPAQKQLAALLLDDPAQQGKAYELATAARKVLPDDPELAQILGIASYERHDYRRAVQLLRESGGKKPLDAVTLFTLGMSQLQMQDKAGARDSLQKALAAGLSEPQRAEAQSAIGSL